jgi:hypothetical protein
MSHHPGPDRALKGRASATLSIKKFYGYMLKILMFLWRCPGFIVTLHDLTAKKGVERLSIINAHRKPLL